MKGFMYILECSDGTYYIGSTNNIYRRLNEHQHGEGANHTAKRLPVKLLYYEEFQYVSQAFNPENSRIFYDKAIPTNSRFLRTSNLGVAKSGFLALHPSTYRTFMQFTSFLRE